MSDYRIDQDRFFDALRDREALHEAAGKKRAADERKRIDQGARAARRLRRSLLAVPSARLAEAGFEFESEVIGLDTEQKAREWVIARMKQRGLLSVDYTDA